MDSNLENVLIKTALKSNMNNKYACAIILRNKILSVGFNSYKPHNSNSIIYECNKHSIHAEKDAIMKIKNKTILKNCKIYIIKIKDNYIEKGIPCPMCYNLLHKYNIYKIF